jgi:polyhydroxyalkanoate synthesis regulator phasin
MARRDYENLFAKLRSLSEDGLTSLFSEVMSNDKMRQSLGRAGSRFMENKHTFDRNIEQFLEFFNVPSRRDVRDLKARLDHLSSQLLNLSIKVDRMAQRENATPPPAVKRARPKTRPRPSSEE